ncbi:MAG: DMT family transporter [Betaproteobacteria bacterium]
MPTRFLFFAAVAIWGTTWIAITVQIDAAAPEVGVPLRFTLAALAAAAWCRWRGIALALPWRTQRWLIALGAAGFCASYLLVYHAERYIVSGLVAVGYAAMPLVNMVAERGFFGTPLSRRVTAGGLLGLAGIALSFEPEFARAATDARLMVGALLTALAVLASSLANMVVLRNHRAGVDGWAPLALAMGWGAAAGWVYAAAIGAPLAIRWSWPFALSLVYLALAGSVLAFAAYYVVVGRIGTARAAYVGVMSTVVALVISTLFEGYDWRWTTAVGILLAVAGNVMALQRKPRSVESGA